MSELTDQWCVVSCSSIRTIADAGVATARQGICMPQPLEAWIHIQGISGDIGSSFLLEVETEDKEECYIWEPRPHWCWPVDCLKNIAWPQQAYRALGFSSMQ